jgi:D-alanyl-D-alanine carboxypeptidase
MSPSPQEVLDRFVADHPEIPGAFMHVRGPGFVTSAAVGVRDVATAEPLTSDATYRIASITKSYVSAAVLRLWEQDLVGLDDPIGKHIGAPLAAALGDSRCERIELRHLLTHTSGLADYYEDTNYRDEIELQQDLDKRWTRLEQVEVSLTLPDVDEPGGKFHYSSTGYSILGEVLEHCTGENLGVALRTLLGFDRLGLTSTYFETREPAPPTAGPRTHQYAGDIDFYGQYPSAHGGSGLVSSSEDVARFFEALFEGKVFEEPGTLDVMTEPCREAYGAVMAMGIAGRDFDGHRFWGHGGSYGVYSGYMPADKVGVSVGMLDRVPLQLTVTELLPAAVAAALALAADSG